MEQVTIYVDGATAGTRHVGVAAVARSKEGFFLGWLSRQLPRMTNNEAEYRAVLTGLDLAQQLAAERVQIVSDSEVVVRQMRGLSRVNSGRLKPLHRETCGRVGDFRQVSFYHVQRDENVLADALATEALQGREVRMRPADTANQGLLSLFGGSVFRL